MNLTVLQLGWGVQSWTLAAMAAMGVIKIDLIVHADTGWERERTYMFAERWQPWLEEHGLIVVSGCARRSKSPLHQSGRTACQYVLIPAFTEGKGGRTGTIRRQCTGDWKVETARRIVKSWMKTNGYPRTAHITKLLGISLDEWTRARDSDKKNETNAYPLLDMKMTRADCVSWLTEHDLEVPMKSSCVMCPYHTNAAWQEMKRENGSDWSRAVEYDAAIRLRKNKDGSDNTPMFCHRSLLPLVEAVILDEELPYEQHSFLDDGNLTCDSGHCFL